MNTSKFKLHIKKAEQICIPINSSPKIGKSHKINNNDILNLNIDCTHRTERTMKRKQKFEKNQASQCKLCVCVCV